MEVDGTIRAVDLDIALDLLQRVGVLLLEHAPEQQHVSMHQPYTGDWVIEVKARFPVKTPAEYEPQRLRAEAFREALLKLAAPYTAP